MKNMGLLDRDVNSGDIIKFERVCGNDHSYRIVYPHGFLQIEYQDLTKLFIKALGKTIYCNSLYIKGQEYQLYKLSEDDFWSLVDGKIFTIYIDRNVFTLRDYPGINPCEKIRDILNIDICNPIQDIDSKFVRSQCMQFDELSLIDLQN